MNQVWSKTNDGAFMGSTMPCWRTTAQQKDEKDDKLGLRFGVSNQWVCHRRWSSVQVWGFRISPQLTQIHINDIFNFEICKRFTSYFVSITQIVRWDLWCFGIIRVVRLKKSGGEFDVLLIKRALLLNDEKSKLLDIQLNFPASNTSSQYNLDYFSYRSRSLKSRTWAAFRLLASRLIIIYI